jgi:hypothetical protein
MFMPKLLKKPTRRRPFGSLTNPIKQGNHPTPDQGGLIANDSSPVQNAGEFIPQQ